jgi:anti-sigma B factor antagonist
MRMAMPDEIPVQVQGGIVIVCPVGELDLAAAPALRAALRRALHVADQGVRVDLSAVTFLDSTALAALVETWREAEATEMSFCVDRAAPNVRRVLEITRLDSLICEH